MRTECTLCGRTSLDLSNADLPRDPIAIENQIANLDRVLESLGMRGESFLNYINDREDMCPMCQELMEEIEDETDRHTLLDRINEKVEELEEKVADRLPGED